MGSQVSGCKGDAVCLASRGVWKIQGVHSDVLYVLRDSALNPKAEARPQTTSSLAAGAALSPTTTAGAAGITSRKRIRLRPEVGWGEAGYPYPLCFPRVSLFPSKTWEPWRKEASGSWLVWIPGTRDCATLAGAWFEGAEARSHKDQHSCWKPRSLPLSTASLPITYAPAT